MKRAKHSSLLLLVAGLGLSSTVWAVQPATTSATKYCELRVGDYAFDQGGGVPALIDQMVVCDLTTSTGSAYGYASATLGTGRPYIGEARTSADTYTNNGIAEANFGANIQYSFEIQQIAAPPTATSLVPILFGAEGDGHAYRSGYAITRSVGVVQAAGNLISYNDALFKFDVQVVDEVAYDPVDEEMLSGGFSGFKHLNLLPDSSYVVVMSAACETWAAPVGQNAAASMQCGSGVSSSVRFDQAAFDVQMGESDTYALSDYYRLNFSENLPAVPEADAYAMMAAGLIVVCVGATRRRVRPTTRVTQSSGMVI